MRKSVCVSIVTFNSAAFISKCLDSLYPQEGFSIGQNLELLVIDNASSDDTLKIVERSGLPGTTVIRNRANLGFCAGQNQGTRIFLDGNADVLVILNPDILLSRKALGELLGALFEFSKVGIACPKLFRADAELRPTEPKILDACGMYVTPALRHLDRGSSEVDSLKYEKRCFVFGGSGACLALKRECVSDLLLEGKKHEHDLGRVYPYLLEETGERAKLFDEAFFAYREDADLAWRANLLGWKCLYVPTSIGFHRRSVLPEGRTDLPKELNLYSVRNRFLLQLNNFVIRGNLRTFIRGVLGRNILVVMGVIFKERTSFPGLLQVFKLLRRALERRKELFRRKKVSDSEIGKWFKKSPYVENI